MDEATRQIKRRNLGVTQKDLAKLKQRYDDALAEWKAISIQPMEAVSDRRFNAAMDALSTARRDYMVALAASKTHAAP